MYLDFRRGKHYSFMNILKLSRLKFNITGKAGNTMLALAFSWLFSSCYIHDFGFMMKFVSFSFKG